MKYSYILCFLCISVVLSSCKKDKHKIDRIGKILWTMPLHKDDVFNSNSITRSHLVFGNKVLIATTEGPNDRYLSCVDAQTGNLLWKWNDIFEPLSYEYMDLTFVHEYANKLTYTMGSRHYCINLEDGSTAWKIRRNNSYNTRISGIGPNYFAMAPPTDTFIGYKSLAIYQGDLNTGDLQQILLTDVDTSTGGESNLITSFAHLKAFELGGKEYLLTASTDPFPNWNYSVFIGLYNLSDQQWIYKRMEVSPPKMNNVISNLVVYEEKIYLTGGNQLFCRDLWTGEAIWDKSFFGDFMFSGFIVENGTVIANCENTVLYGLDANTGHTRWAGEGAGTSSPLEGRYLNGIVYFYGGSTGHIHAVDTETGETVWRYDSDQVDKDVDWKPDVCVIPGQNGEKGRVVLCTHMDAYCVEAYR